EGHWREVEKVCQDEPRTIVHGDFVIKNVRVRTTVGSTSFLVFDWENAGWGVPCTDLAQLTARTVSPDLDSYASALRGSWPGVSGVRVRELAECGRFFRLLDEIGWESPLLTFGPYRFVVKPASRLRVYQVELHRALLAVGWVEGRGRLGGRLARGTARAAKRGTAKGGREARASGRGRPPVRTSGGEGVGRAEPGARRAGEHRSLEVQATRKQVRRLSAQRRRAGWLGRRRETVSRCDRGGRAGYLRGIPAAPAAARFALLWARRRAGRRILLVVS